VHVWCRLNRRSYAGALTPRLGLFVSGGALDALDSGQGYGERSSKAFF